MIFVPVPEEANYDITKLLKGLVPVGLLTALPSSAFAAANEVRRFRRYIVLHLYGDAIRYDFLSGKFKT